MFNFNKHPVRMSKSGDSDSESDDDTDEVFRLGDTIYFYGTVNTRSLKQLKSCLYTANNRHTIRIVINSIGGDACVGLAMYDCIRSFKKCRIWTHIEGHAGSAATLLFLGGHKRTMSEHSTFMIHSIRSKIEGTLNDLITDVRNTDMMERLYRNIYYRKSNLKMPEIMESMKDDRYWTKAQVLARGLLTR